jgi:hypothetical protein
MLKNSTLGIRFFAARGSLSKPKIARAFTWRKNFNQRSRAARDYNARRVVDGRRRRAKTTSEAEGGEMQRQRGDKARRER